MSVVQKIIAFFSTRRGFAVAMVLIFILATFSRFYKLSVPKNYYFDEVYHALTSKLIARGDPRAYEWWNQPVEPNTAVDWLHPPLAKYTQALSMKILGENSFGWRFSSAVFGLLTIAATALIAQLYFRKRAVTLLAALLTSLDGLLLAQSRIAMNDIHVTFFILTTVALYGMFRLKLEKGLAGRWYLLATGVSAGLAMGSKWSGIFVLAALWIAEGLRLFMIKRTTPRRFSRLLQFLLFLVVIPALVYLSSYTHMFLQGKTLICTGTEVKQGQCYCSQESSGWVKFLTQVAPAKKAQWEKLEARGGCKRLISHFSELHHQIFYYQTHLTATHPYQSRPWQWALDLRPVWQYVNYEQINQGLVGNIYNIGNPLLFWLGLLVVVAAIGLFLAQGLVPHVLSPRLPQLLNWRVGFLILVYLIVWVPWNFSPRIMFFYHYAPAVPIMAILLAFTFNWLYHKFPPLRLILVGLVGLIAAAYFVIFPLNTGLLVPKTYSETIFKLFPSWK